jgi:hypothetical protein
MVRKTYNMLGEQEGSKKKKKNARKKWGKKQQELHIYSERGCHQEAEINGCSSGHDYMPV